MPQQEYPLDNLLLHDKNKAFYISIQNCHCNYPTNLFWGWRTAYSSCFVLTCLRLWNLKHGTLMFKIGYYSIFFSLLPFATTAIGFSYSLAIPSQQFSRGSFFVKIKKQEQKLLQPRANPHRVGFVKSEKIKSQVLSLKFRVHQKLEDLSIYYYIKQSWNMIKSMNRTISRKGSTFSEVTSNTFKREILMKLKRILTKRIQRTNI